MDEKPDKQGILDRIAKLGGRAEEGSDADRWQDVGREALVLKPPVEGQDWDDYLGTLQTPEKPDDHCVEPGFDDQFDPDREAIGDG